MNEIMTQASTAKNELRELLIDGRPLVKHFAGAQGAHPDLVFALSCTGSAPGDSAQVSKQLLGEEPSPLDSGRIPVLVCPECGDIGCGVITVRVTLQPDEVVWNDWKFENGYEPERDTGWHSPPGEMRFSLAQYRKAIREAT